MTEPLIENAETAILPDGTEGAAADADAILTGIRILPGIQAAAAAQHGHLTAAAEDVITGTAAAAATETATAAATETEIVTVTADSR